VLTPYTTPKPRPVEPADYTAKLPPMRKLMVSGCSHLLHNKIITQYTTPQGWQETVEQVNGKFLKLRTNVLGRWTGLQCYPLPRTPGIWEVGVYWDLSEEEEAFRDYSGKKHTGNKCRAHAEGRLETRDGLWVFGYGTNEVWRRYAARGALSELRPLEMEVLHHGLVAEGPTRF
jgi:hypothetical protein